ncbi:MAG TPA: hypothetical protein VMG59_13835 [Phycisphaerae bacterium]|nr:hypothetical protein [Phycisphaerae bacterium]
MSGPPDNNKGFEETRRTIRSPIRIWPLIIIGEILLIGFILIFIYAAIYLTPPGLDNIRLAAQRAFWINGRPTPEALIIFFLWLLGNCPIFVVYGWILLRRLIKPTIENISYKSPESGLRIKLYTCYLFLNYVVVIGAILSMIVETFHLGWIGDNTSGVFNVLCLLQSVPGVACHIGAKIIISSTTENLRPNWWSVAKFAPPVLRWCLYLFCLFLLGYIACVFYQAIFGHINMVSDNRTFIYFIFCLTVAIASAVSIAARRRIAAKGITGTP